MKKRKRFLTFPLALGLGLTLALLWLIGRAGPARADPGDLYVAPTGNDDTLCTQAEPCRTVQRAVDVAVDNDTIHVAQGLYTGTHSRPAPPGYENSTVITQVVYISKTVTVRGEYGGTFDSRAPAAYAPTLDAQGDGRVIFITGDVTVTLENLRIVGGDANGMGGGRERHDAGGGIYVLTTTTTISGCHIVSNTVEGTGGGIYLRHSDGSVLNGNVISGNVGSSYGGGVYLDYSDNVTLNGNTISGNMTSEWGGYGGGVSIWSSNDATLNGNTIRDNTTGSDGGGVLVIESSGVTLIDNTVRDNTITDNQWVLGGGGGVLFYNCDNATLVSNTIAGNITHHDSTIGGGVSVGNSRNITVSNNTILSNTSSGGGGVVVVSYGYTFTNVKLSGNTIRGNIAAGGGGVFLVNADHTELSNNAIINNTSLSKGGGVYMLGSDDVTLANNVIADNHAWRDGGGVYVEDSSASLRHTTLARNGGDSGLCVVTEYYADSSTVALTNTVLVSHTVGITVTAGSSVILNGVLWHGNAANTGGAGVVSVTNAITGPPAFAADGYHLTGDSAALDAGVVSLCLHDIDGEARPSGLGYDIGADEYYFPTLQVNKWAYPDPVQAGAPLTYTIRVVNTSGIDLHATITDTLPLSVTLGETSGGTLLLPGGAVGITWTALIPASGGIWDETVIVTVAEGHNGPLLNVVKVTTEEGAVGKAIAIVNAHEIYLPLVLRYN